MEIPVIMVDIYIRMHLHPRHGNVGLEDQLILEHIFYRHLYRWMNGWMDRSVGRLMDR